MRSFSMLPTVRRFRHELSLAEKPQPRRRHPCFLESTEMAGTGSKPEYVGQSALMKVCFLTCLRTSPTMNFNNPLVPVYKAFAVANDCFKVATRTIQIQHEELIRRTQFIGATPEEANTAL